MIKRSIYALLVAILFYSCGGTATNSAETPNSEVAENKEDDKGPDTPKDYETISEEAKKEAEDKFLVPSPGEVLTALNKFGDVDWTKLASMNGKSDYADGKYSRTLNLGIKIADAYIAINKEDKIEYGKMSLAIFKLGDAIGIGEVLIRNKDKLIKLSDAGEWSKLKAELNVVQSEVTFELEKLNEDELVTLASLAGWLEGFNVLSNHLKDNYDEENSKMLAVGTLIDYYEASVNNLSEDAKNDSRVKYAIKSLHEISKIINSQEEVVISQKDISVIAKSTKDAIAKIEA